MPSAHAKLQPSKAETWMNCPGSVALSENVVDTGGSYADEGTACHELAERGLNGADIEKLVGKKAQIGLVFTEEMVRLVRPCIEWVKEYEDATGAKIHTEMQVEIGDFFGIPKGIFWGTSDVIGESADELLVLDFKFGYNEVEIKRNPQLISYSAGAWAKLDRRFSRVRNVIIQPKCSSEPKEIAYSSEEFAKITNEISPKVQAAVKGGPLVPSPEACKWCKSKPVCPALRGEIVALAQREFAENVVHLTPEDLGELLLKLELLEPAAKSIRNHALKLMAVGTDIPGWKRVTGKTNRAWLKAIEQTAEGLKKMGVDPWEKSIISPAGAEEKLIEILAPKEKTKKAAKAAAKEMLKTLAGNPPGKPTLAKADDERPALPPEFTSADVEAFSASSVDEID